MSRHLSSLRKRYQISKDTEVTIDLLAEKSKIDVADLKSIYSKAKEKLLKTGKAEQDLDQALKTLSEKVGLIETKTKPEAEAKEKATKKITAMGTVKKTGKKAAKKADKKEKAPDESPKLERQDAVDPHAHGMAKVYEFVSRLEGYNENKLKHPPPPKKIAAKYIKAAS